MFVMTASGNDFENLGFGFGLTTRQQTRLLRKEKRSGGLTVVLPPSPKAAPKILPKASPPDPVPVITTTRQAKKMERKAKRGKLDILPAPGPEPVPVLTTRQERRLERKKKKGLLDVILPSPQPEACIQGACAHGYCESGSMCCPPPPLMGPCIPKPGGGTPPPTNGGGGGSGCTTSEYGCSSTTPTLGACLQCCAHNFGERRPRKACKRECDRCFAAGGGGGTVPPGPEPVPTQSCGYECVGPTDTGGQQCEWVCHDYGGAGAPAAPSDDRYVPPSGGGYAPGGGTPYMDEAALMGTEQPAEEEQTFLQKYGLWLAIGGALVIGYAATKRRR